MNSLNEIRSFLDADHSVIKYGKRYKKDVKMLLDIIHDLQIVINYHNESEKTLQKLKLAIDQLAKP